MKVLNCSKNGDTTYHPCVYKTELFGKKDYVERIFRSVRINEKGQIAESLEDTRYIRIKNRQLPKEILESFYYAIWYQAFCGDKNLAKYIIQFDAFEDGKNEKCMNSQAKVFKAFKEGGKPALKELSNDFAQALAQAPIDFYPIQTTANAVAREFVMEEKDKESAKDECIERLHKADITNADDIVSKLCMAYYEFYCGNANQNYAVQKRDELKDAYTDYVLSMEA